MSAVTKANKKWYILAAVAISTFLSTVDGSIVNVALPTLVRELESSFSMAQWVILAYLLTQTILLLTVGRLGDMLGKKPLYTTGIAIFTTGSLLCALSPSIHWLVGFRVVQAVGAAMALALGMTIVTEAFPAAERGKALGLFGTVVSIGIVVGPTLGGIILESLSWRWIFFVNLPVGLLGVYLALRYIPHSRPAGKQLFDFPGAITLALSLLALLLALTWGQQLGFTDRPIIFLFTLFFLFLLLFLYLEWRAPQPMIDLRLFRSRHFSLGLSLGLLAFVAVAGSTLLLPFYLNNMLGFSPRQVGLMMALIPIFLGVSAPLSGTLSDRLGTRPIATAGLAVAMVSYILMSRFDLDTGLLVYAASVSLLGLGMGIFQSPNNSAVMGAAPPERLGVASSLLGISRTLGQIIGIAVLGAFWASRVTIHAGYIPSGGATTAPVGLQVMALQETFLVMAVLLGFALLLSAWALVQVHRQE
jgi:EmrB/QacA subfamily drug resistance transporter